MFVVCAKHIFLLKNKISSMNGMAITRNRIRRMADYALLPAA